MGWRPSRPGYRPETSWPAERRRGGTTRPTTRSGQFPPGLPAASVRGRPPGGRSGRSSMGSAGRQGRGGRGHRRPASTRSPPAGAMPSCGINQLDQHRPWPRPLIIAAINNGSEHHRPRPRCSVPVRLGSRGLLSPQLTACFTSAAILASSAAVNSVSAKATGHMAPSSRFATSLKPKVAYRDLNLSAAWKKQTTLPSLA
jgi:hypothetical protein